MSWFGHGSRAVAVLLLAVVLVWTVAACGSGAVEGPDDEASSDGGGDNGGGDNGGGDNGGGDNGGGDNGGGDNGGDDEFSWSLPGGDLSTDSQGAVFNHLIRGECDDAKDGLPGSVEELGWPDYQKLLWEAAIAVCSGDLEGGREKLNGAGLTDYPGDCRLYKAIRSVLDQRPQGSIDCPDPQSETGTLSTESTTTTESDDSTTESTTTSTSSPGSTDVGDGSSTSTVGGGTDTAG